MKSILRNLREKLSYKIKIIRPFPNLLRRLTTRSSLFKPNMRRRNRDSKLRFRSFR
jgi:hypothetical protein